MTPDDFNLRDMIAIEAMSAILRGENDFINNLTSYDAVAETAYAVAAAMLRARELTPSDGKER